MSRFFHKTIVHAAAILCCAAFCTGCTTPENSSQPGTAEIAVPTEEVTAEPEYSVDMVLTIIFPDMTKYTSTDNGLTWVTDEAEYYNNKMPAYLTTTHADPISISSGIPITLTIHNHNLEQDVLGGGSYIEIVRYEDGEWVPAEYADKTKNYGFTDQMDVIYFARDYYEYLDIYEPVGGRYRMTKKFTIIADDLLGNTPSDLYGVYTMSAEFNALP